MKRKSLFNKIISLSIAAVVFLTSSASAYADVENAPAENSSVEVSEEAAVSDLSAAEEGKVAEGQPEQPVEEAVTGDVNEPAKESEATETTEAQADKSPIAEIIEKVLDVLNPTDETDAEDAEEAKEDELNPDDAEDTEEDEDSEDTDKECEHELIYTSNKDGTHTVKCNNCDLEEYTESCEFDESGKCIHCGFERLPDPILVYEDEEVIVTVSGDVPENADLRVTPIKKDVEETAEAYEQVAEKVQNNTELKDFERLGFLAYDISFISLETNEEVEPDGNVTVSMEYKSPALPIDNLDMGKVESIDVSLIHFNEETGDVDNLTDDNKATLELDEGNAITKAEFTSDSFSTYVFTYRANENEKIKIIFNNLDRNNENITEVSTTEKAHTVSSATQVDRISSFTDRISGYRFVEARYNTDDGYVVFDSFHYETVRTGGLIIANYTGYIILYLGDQAVTNRIEITDELIIDMIYEKNVALSITKKATGAPAADSETAYKFKLTNASGQPVANKSFKVKNTNKTTDSNGMFELKAGESADFESFNTGTYTITESEVLGDAYTLADFKTMIFVDGELYDNKPYSPEFAGDRKAEFTIENNKLTDIIVKNYYYTKEIKSESEEVLSKYIKYDSSADDYNVQLKFVGPEKVVEETSYEVESEEVIKTKKVNIILVVDRSGSMGQYSRSQHMQGAATLMAEVFKTKRNVEAKWKVVDFGTSANLASVTQNWVDTQTFYDIASKKGRRLSYSGNDPYSNSSYGFDWYYDGYSNKGATNYEDALINAKQQLDTAPADEDKVVIFLTDGVPTMYNGSTGSGANFAPEAYKKAITAAEQITCSAFYAIGVDFDNESYKVDGKAYYARDMLANISNEVTASDRSVSTVDASKVAALFKSLAGQISSVTTGEEKHVTTTYGAENVVITDPLSEYVEIEPNTEFYVSVEIDNVDQWQTATYVNGKIGSDGKQINGASYNLVVDDKTYVITADYDAEKRQMVMRFPEGCPLKTNYSFKLSFQVIPSDEAYEEYLANGYGDVVGDENTDNGSVPVEKWTSSGKPGFRSNGTAIAEYEFQGNSLAPEFPHPVIQVHIVNEWFIYKTNAEGESLGGAEFLLKDANDNQEAYLGTSDLSKNGLIDWNLEDGQSIATGKTYKLTEELAPFGYAKSGDYWEIVVDEDNKPTVTAYTAQGEQGEYTMLSTREGNKVTYKLFFKNYRTAYELPQTGGNGIYRTTLYGVVLMMISVFLFYKNKKKNKTFTN